MELEGIHHITAITGEAQRNVDFYVEVMGLRMIKKTVNFDQPDVYHLYYGDDPGSPGAAMTFFEFPDAPRGKAGAGMVHTIIWRVGNSEALDFWDGRLRHAGLQTEHDGDSIRSADPEGLGLEFTIAQVDDTPLTASAPDIPAEFALQGFHGARAYTHTPLSSNPLLAELNFKPSSEAEVKVDFSEPTQGYMVKGENRQAIWVYDSPPLERGFTAAGTVHHIAWASHDEDHENWRSAASEGGASPTPIIDRKYFHSIYFREPSGVLFEIATLSPGFTVDEPLEELGEHLVLPEHLESRREHLKGLLTPIRNPRKSSV